MKENDEAEEVLPPQQLFTQYIRTANVNGVTELLRSQSVDVNKADNKGYLLYIYILIYFKSL